MMHLVHMFDQQIVQYLYDVRSLPVTQFFIAVTQFGELLTIYGLLIAISAWLLLRKYTADVAGLLVSVCGSGLTILVLKYLVARDRPDRFFHAYFDNPAYMHLSFPSGHAGLSMALYGYLSYLLLQTYPTFFRQILVFALPALSMLIGISRVYLGVHYATDVIAGFSIGVAFVYIGAEARLRALVFMNPHTSTTTP